MRGPGDSLVFVKTLSRRNGIWPLSTSRLWRTNSSTGLVALEDCDVREGQEIIAIHFGSLGSQISEKRISFGKVINTFDNDGVASFQHSGRTGPGLPEVSSWTRRRRSSLVYVLEETKTDPGLSDTLAQRVLFTHSLVSSLDLLLC